MKRSGSRAAVFGLLLACRLISGPDACAGQGMAAAATGFQTEFRANPAVEAMLADVRQSALFTYVGQLTGEMPVEVGGVTARIASRHTVSSDGGILLATQFAFEHMQSLGLSVRYEGWSGCGDDPSISSRNVIAEKAGVSLPGEIVVILAHLDSRPAGSPSYGADDDASGSAGVLVAADILSRYRLRRTVRFLLTTGEEQGLCGAAAHAASARSAGENIVAVCNLDMIGWNRRDGPTLRLHTRTPDRPGHAADLEIASVFTTVVSTYGLDLVPIIAADYAYSLRNADQVNFWDYGYPGILAIEDNQDDFNTDNYHTLNDRLETLNLPYLTSFVRAAVGTLAHLAHVEHSTLEFTLLEGGAGSALTAGHPGPAEVGYADATISSGDAPCGIAVLSYNQNGVVVSEAAVPASPPTAAARIFLDYRSSDNAATAYRAGGSVATSTGLAVLNPGSVPAAVTYTLREAAGAILATGHGTVAGGSHFAKLVHQLADVAPDFAFPGDFIAVRQVGSLEVSSDQPLSVLALRLTVNQRNETLLTTTPTADLTAPAGSARLYFPQSLDGGGYTTSIVLLNTSSAAETGTLSLRGDEGAPLSVSRLNGPVASTFDYTILPGGVFVFQTAGLPETARTGWVEVIPAPGNSSPAAAGIIALTQQDVLVTETGVPAAIPTRHARILVDQSLDRSTGLAVADPGGSGLDVTLRAVRMDGSTAAGSGAARVTLGGNGHAAGFVSQLLRGLPVDFAGVVEMTSSSPFVALTLRSLTNARGDFLLTTFPVADAARPASAPLIFPHIADGGGYVTEFILLSVAGPTQATLRLHRDDGSPLDVAR